MADNETKPRRQGSFLKGLTALGLLIGIVAAMVSIFEVGIMTGLAIAGCGFVIYAVPAAILGWPLPSLQDLLAVVTGIIWGIVGLFLSIFD